MTFIAKSNVDNEAKEFVVVNEMIIFRVIFIDNENDNAEGVVWRLLYTNSLKIFSEVVLPQHSEQPLSLSD